MKIDAHQHFWKYDPVKDGWITDDMKVIKRNFMPSDLKPIFDENAIDGCVAVQADQSEEETDFLIDLAKDNVWIKGVVGWVDLLKGDLSDRLEHFKTFERFKGVRHIIQAEPDGFMTNQKFIDGVTEVGRKKLTYDVLTNEKQLPEAAEFINKLPEMRLVVDHISKPNIKDKSFDHWAKQMKKISDFKHVSVKLSGMVTEANWGDWESADFEPYVDFCLEHFGPQRLMYGSDWPVCLLAGSYQNIHQSIKTCISKLSEAEQNLILGQTASRFYELN